MVREIYDFGDFVLDVDAHQLSKRSERIDLPPLSFNLLLCLVRAAPDSVSRDSLMQSLWPDRVVGEETLTERVKLLRRELAAGDEDTRLIVTERGWGYRLAVTPTAAVPGQPQSARSRLAVGLTILAVVIAGLLMFAYLQQHPGSTDTITLAVRPFSDLTAESDAKHLAAGVTEELNVGLARLNPEHLLVLGQSTSASLGDDAEYIKGLGVDYLVDGSVRDKNNTRFIAVRLTRAADARQVWTYDAPVSESGSLRWQRDLVAEVAIALTVSADASELAASGEVSQAARDAYLRGRYAWRYWTSQGFGEALTYFEQAIALQPDYVDAHAGLADALGTLAFSGALPHEDAFERARAHAATALELAPRSAQARSSMAMINLFADRQPILAAEVLSELLLEDPNNERLLLAMANVRWAQGCHVNAISVMSQASRVDPHSPIMRSGLALSHYLAGDYAEARAQALIVLDAEPAYAHAVFIAAMSAALMGDHHDALQLLDQGGGDELVSARGYVLAASGDERAAAELLHRPWGRRAYLARARLYAAIGRWAEASNEVETAVESREPSALLVRRYPTLREIPLADSVEAELDRLDGDCI